MRRLKRPTIRRLTSIRSRLTFWNVLALTVALTAVSIQIRISVRANILASIDRELSSMARYGSRLVGRRGRGRGSVSGAFGSTFPSPTFSGTMRQLDAQIGLPTPQGTSPAPAIDLQRPQDSALNNGQRQSNPAAGTPSIQAQPLDQAQAPSPGAPARLRNAIPNSPATRVLINGPRTFLNEAPWDLNAYTRSLASNSDVYTTLISESRSTRILTRPIRSAYGGPAVVQAAFPLSEMERAVHSLDITLLTTIPLVLLIAGVGGAFLTDRAMRPVRHIARTAEQIGAEDLSRRLPVGSDDEFSQLADTFNAMLGRLETSFAQQRRFTADASHELKSPLTVIKANATLALRSPRSADEYVRRIEAIDKASNHMRVLVDDLLLLARADEGMLQPGGQGTHLPDRDTSGSGRLDSPPRFRSTFAGPAG